MSEEHVREIVLKAFDDAEFRALLTSDLAKATEGYELTEVEVENLKKLDADFFDPSLELEQRISRAGFMN